MKKIVAFFCVVCMLFSIIPAVPVLAASTDGISIAADPDSSSYASETYMISEKLPAVPHTFEALVHVPTSQSSSAGCILGNYQGYYTPYVNLYVYSNGNPRFLYRDGTNNEFNLIFTNVDVRSSGYTHLAITVDAQKGQVHCYKNGVLAETKEIYPDLDGRITDLEFAIGGDHRTLQEGGAYFKGKIKGVAMYSDVRTADEIKADMTATDKSDENLLVSYTMTADDARQNIEDESKNKNTLVYSKYYMTEAEKLAAFGQTPEYEYSFAVVGDLHTAHHMANATEKANFKNFFKWIADNTEDKKIKYVITTGDISDTETDTEFEFVKESLSVLEGKVDYSLIQGNHDYYNAGSAYTTAGGNKLDAHFASYAPYTNQFTDNGGYYKAGSVENTYRTLKAGNTDWLLLNLDYGANDSILAWAGNIIAQHPDHKVIITTHNYLYSDGTTVGDNDNAPPSKDNSTYNDGDDMWNKLVSKYENITMVISGHQMDDDTVMTQTKGENGNTVTQFLINPQQPNTRKDFLGIVSMFYFSKDGKTVTVENYSTTKNAYFKHCNMLTFTLDSDCEEASTEWNGSSEAPKGTGTKADPYIIENGGNLVWMSNQCTTYNSTGYFDGKYFKQVNDIDLGGRSIKSIGYYLNYASTSNFTNAFSGTYDGQGYSIKNGFIKPYVYYDHEFNRYWGHGLFGCVYGAEIKNVTLDDIQVLGQGVTGGIVGIAGSPRNTASKSFNKITNCHVTESCTFIPRLTRTNTNTSSTSYDNVYTSGMLGSILGQGYATDISYCTSAAKLRFDGVYTMVGGIAAGVGHNSTIDSCIFTGGITLINNTAKATTSVGGILGATTPNNGTGSASATQKSGTFKISNCVNKGYIEYTGEKLKKNIHIGCVVGFAGILTADSNAAKRPSYTDTPNYLMENCYNLYSRQKIDSYGAEYWSGGLLGKAQIISSNGDYGNLWIRDSYSVDIKEKYTSAVNVTNEYACQNNKSKYGWYGAETILDSKGNKTVGTKTAEELAPYVKAIETEIIKLNGGYTFEDGTLTIYTDLGDFTAKNTPWAEYANDVKSVVVAEGVTEIGSWAFGYFYNAETITLPSTLKTIGTSSFYRCESLKELVIPESVETIKNGAFSYCYALSEVTVPEGITAIGSYTFYDCNKLQKVTAPQNLTIGTGNDPFAAAYESGVEEELTFEWKVEDGVLTISGNTYMPDYTAKNTPWYDKQSEIKKVVIEDGILGIGNYSFAYLTALKEVEIASSVKEIGTYAFYGCGYVKEITIPSAVKEIGNGAFAYCILLEKVTLSPNQTKIGSYAFYDCRIKMVVSAKALEDIAIAKGNEPLYAAVLNKKEVPEANVHNLGEQTVKFDGAEYTLETAYAFVATEGYEEVNANSEYKYYHADFVVSFDKDITDIALAGYYDEYAEAVMSTDWVPFMIENAKAGEEIRLLDEFWYNGEGSISYQELCYIEKFLCGALDVGDNDEGAKMTVELRLYEVTENAPSTSVETGEFVTVGSYTYTF